MSGSENQEKPEEVTENTTSEQEDQNSSTNEEQNNQTSEETSSSETSEKTTESSEAESSTESGSEASENQENSDSGAENASSSDEESSESSEDSQKEDDSKDAAWDQFFENHQLHQEVDATLIRSIKGGYLVNVGVSAFLPTSQASPKGEEPSFVAGDNEPFKVELIELVPEKRNVVVSRKNILDRVRKKERESFIDSLSVGQICEGKVQDITDFGAFIRLGGVIDGLLHIKDMSWDHVHHPRDMLETQQTIKVKILKIDKHNEKISLGLKQITDGLWDTAVADFPVNSKVKGKVVSLKPFGAFIRLKEGIEGLLHISQVSRKKLNHPSELLEIGQEVTTIILSVDPNQKRIALGMKQLEADPWSDVTERYFVGKDYKGTITGIVPFGAFVQLEEGVEGLIHISKLSEDRIESPTEVVSLGDEVTVSILDIQESDKRIRLSLVL